MSARIINAFSIVITYVKSIFIFISIQDQLFAFKCSMKKDYDTLVTKERELCSEVCVYVCVFVCLCVGSCVVSAGR